ncbi:hormogonium polysaccharide biosynthesis protein HpsA [Geitlerinema sp. PCC 7407]|uniref:hormogonium polysaccharide biosynthesis protein HpsA n=1 Tax=Geitlerinema sp. PCC 7407 TaxID=1173025 RepID=UPI00029FFC73|nr:hormogonium polysaccharide biosynthesis protein HpsA [Geitlerinema sp. PCC 7407]AFY67745.1 hypothetical protein GEI7407_3277 [Geitlerinema sp. PCC 7407]
MSSRQFQNIVQAFVSQLEKIAASEKSLRQQLHWLLRSQMLTNQARSSEAGFVLPTVVMVTLVVVLLTTALVLRSFDRSRNARNFRVNETVLNAAAPALDRARAKIDALFRDPTLPRSTPSELALYSAMQNGYTFDDEARLTLSYDNDEDGTIDDEANPLLNNEKLNTAWKFPVDTDNNGKYDSFTLYGLYFRTPSRDASNNFTRERKPLDARTPPMEDGSLPPECSQGSGTSASLIGGSDWYKSNATLKKSFFVYSATVPITNLADLDVSGTNSNWAANQFEQRTAAVGSGFSALEYQQDRVRVPLSNNAVWFEDDLEVADPGSNFRLNGRVVTNSNLLAAGRSDSARVLFYQVSSPNSCFYQKENSEIIVAGNVANGSAQSAADAQTSSQARTVLHLYRGAGVAPAGDTESAHRTPGAGVKVINTDNKTTTAAGGQTVAFNSQAYEARIGLMLDTALAIHRTNHPSYNATTNPEPAPTTASVTSNAARVPQEVEEAFDKSLAVNSERQSPKKPEDILREEYERYFRQRTRKVPYADVAFGADGLEGKTAATVFPATGDVRPPVEWMSPDSANTGLTLKTDATNPLLFLPALDPEQVREDGRETRTGDRIIVGNGLPYIWTKLTTTGTFSSFAAEKERQPVFKEQTAQTTPLYWDLANGSPDTDEQRYRQSQIENIPDLGDTGRNGFWEQAAAKLPDVEGYGGLRVITGAGLYYRSGSGISRLSSASFLSRPQLVSGLTNPDPPELAGNDAAAYTIVWPDSMPMKGGKDATGTQITLLPDFRMRATVVYHYTTSAGADQKPIACVSSYLDPTDATSKLNGPYGAGGAAAAFNANASGRSNNGVSFAAPYASSTDRLTYLQSKPDYKTELIAQAQMMFPDGRLANPALHEALAKLDTSLAVKSSATFTLADKAAIDAALCELQIADGTLTASNTVIPHGAIREQAFLDGRQVKALNTQTSGDKLRVAEKRSELRTTYDLPLEQRQPLEIRVTELDLELLRGKTIGSQVGTAGEADDAQEFLLPNSGIIYATREDALPDVSSLAGDNPSVSSISSQVALTSPTDFKLDPSRRPNGIRLINGSDLARKDTYRVAEKGLILASNLPVYVRGDFNLHKDPGGNTVREEFDPATDALAANWSNFYTRDDLDPNFACRAGQTNDCDDGDQWRPATIITDAITLLSANFLDGSRVQGDYDLRNNSGNSAAGRRVQSGLYANNFVTTYQWWSGNSSTDTVPTNDAKVSYFMNGVTPVQRRHDVQAYETEICRKIPVSECGPIDWIRYVDGTDPVDTAEPSLPGDERFARRVRFKRDLDSGVYYYDAQGYPEPYPTTKRRNSLWFVTRDANGNRTYDANTNNKLYVSFAAANQGLPSLGGLRGLAAANDRFQATFPTNETALDDPITTLGTNVPQAVKDQIEALYDAFAALPSTDTISSLTTGTRTLVHPGGGVKVYSTSSNLQIGGNGNNPPAVELTLEGDPSSIFVFKVDAQFALQANASIKLVGVPADNVYWVVSGQVSLGENSVMRGNIISKAALKIGTSQGGATLYGRAFTSAANSDSNFLNGNSSIYIPEGAQPIVEPVLQIFNPTGDPDATAANAFGGLLEDRWLIPAAETTFNAAFVSGDSPSHPNESNGGLLNFVRFLEAWPNAAKISGSFIQNRRSAYATGPFQSVSTPATISNSPSTLFFTQLTSNQPLYLSNLTASDGYTGFRYRGGGAFSTAPYYEPPTRTWGFDVALLTQSPDVFANQFTIEPNTQPNEFYREVGRDDPWVATLLCAENEAGGNAVNDSERPTSCP